MAHIAIPTEYDSKSILVADDEREHVEFLIDYLEAKHFNVAYAASAEEALAIYEKKKFRAYFIDLNIPLGSLTHSPNLSDVYERYVGLQIIRAIRTQGNSGARVIAYSAHYNEQIVSEIDRLYCKYVVKGRPKELKQALEEVLKTDPLSSNQC